MSNQKKDLKDLVAGDKVVLVKKPPSDTFLGYFHEIGDVFTVRAKGQGIATPVCHVVGKGGIKYTSCAIKNEFLEHYVEEEQNMFTKNDLKTGMWVEFAGGDVGIVLEVGDTKYVVSCDDYRTCISKIDSSYTKDMFAVNRAYDIVKVWSPNSNCNYLLTSPGRVLWVAVKPPVKTEQELAHEKLMSQIAELEEKTRELREQAKKLGESK